MTQMIESPAPQTAVAKRAYEPLAPVGSANALKSLLETQKNSLAQMLPKHVTPERLFKTLLVASNRNPDIFKCTQSSIIETINRAAELGLDLSGTLGEAYPVPFNNKVKTSTGEQWVMQLQLIIGYRGMEKLAWQTGEVESIDAEVVYEKDSFTFKKGTEVLVEWSPHLGDDRGEVVGAYACVKMKAGGKLARFLTKGDIEKIRNSSKSANSPAWRNWWGEMARKCALKRTLKDAPLSTEKFVKAMEFESEDLTDVLAATTGGGQARGVAALARRLTNRPVSEGQTFEPSAEALDVPSHEDAEQIINNAPRAPENQQHQEEPDTGGVEAEAPSELLNLTFEAFVAAAEDLAKSFKIGPDVFDAVMGKLKLSHGGGKRKDMEGRAALLQAMNSGQFDWKTGKVLS